MVNHLLITSEIIKEEKEVVSYKKIHSEKSKLEGELFFNLIESNDSLSRTSLYLLKVYLESIDILDILNEDNLVNIKHKNYLDEIESIIFCKDNTLVLDIKSSIWINQYKEIYHKYKNKDRQILFDLKESEFYVIQLFKEVRDFYKPKTIIPLKDSIINDIRNIQTKEIPVLNLHQVSKDNFLNYSTSYYRSNNKKPYSYHGEQKTATLNELIEHMDSLISINDETLDINSIKEQRNKLIPYLKENKHKKILFIND